MSWISKFLKGRRGPSALDILSATEWRCATCDQLHNGLFALAVFAPDPWRGADRYAPNDAIRLDGDFLSEDFCVLGGEYFMVRAVLEIPVDGLAEPLSFGVWSSLSRENFEKYLAGFDDSAPSDMGPWSGWLCNRVADYVGNDPLALWVVPQKNRQRPKLYVMDDPHPLAVAQDKGISAEKVLEIYGLYGHRPANL